MDIKEMLPYFLITIMFMVIIAIVIWSIASNAGGMV